MEPRFFASPAKWRAWLEKNHERCSELLVGFYKKDSGLPSITWPESVDEALCFGWIDGIRRKIDDSSYSIRFTPRKARSTWSAANIRRAGELEALGLMHPAGLKAFRARLESRSAVYAFEQKQVSLEPAQELDFQANAGAWRYFQAQAPSYQRVAIWWVISAKRAETRKQRLSKLIGYSEQEQRLPQYRRSS